MKWLFWALAALTLILLAALITAWSAPQLLLSAVNSNSRFDANADSIEIAYFPPSVKFENLVVSTSGSQFAEFKILEATSTWRALLKSRAPLAKIRAKNGDVNLNNMRGLYDEKNAKKSTTQLNLFDLANSVRLDVENVSIQIDELSSVNVVRLDNSLNKANEQTPKLAINTSATYTNGPSSLFINGITVVENQNNRDRVNIKLDKLDLSQLSEQQDDQLLGKNQIDLKQAETDIDWAWMNSLRDCQFDVEINEVRFAQGSFENFTANIALTDSIQLAANGILDFPLNSEGSINQLFSIEAKLTPIATSTKASDVDGSIVVKTATAELSADGQFNLNALNDTSLNVSLALESLPQSLNIGQLEQYLPLKASGQAITQEARISINQLESTLGKSNLNGKFDIGVTSAQQIEADFDVRSTLLSYYDTNQDGDQNTDSENVDDAQTEVGPLFSNEALDWSWLGKLTLTGQALIDEFQYEKSTFTQLSLAIVADEQGFNINSLKSELNSGKLEGELQIRPNKGGAKVKSTLSFSDINMSESGLFEDGEIKGGLTSGRFNIESSGQSISDLAANSNGSLLIDVNEGEIAQGSMDLLGSDLILSTLSKLNPFSKSDPSTTLECAVINLDINEGIVRSKNSIAMETSKVAIVGTGKINLNNETLDLKLNPKPKKSLGVNLSSLAKAVKLGGSLRKPTPEISALGIAETGLSVGAAISTGGLSLLAEGLLDDVTAGQACENARRAFDTKIESPARQPSKQALPEKMPQIDLKEIELPGPTAPEDTSN